MTSNKVLLQNAALRFRAGRGEVNVQWVAHIWVEQKLRVLAEIVRL